MTLFFEGRQERKPPFGTPGAEAERLVPQIHYWISIEGLFADF
ncbi:MAG TPA: hypothetical protein PKC65_01135 [Pyrinomonadaceae bacterium]|nr:hypothetical protein [Pyrinomonadaceae bacterium]HMU33323.1 hypothetical protein [Pyrinomonadaceae bacterium]